jgi:hypothetical protein
MAMCDMCLKESDSVKRVPSRSQLLFGGFNVKMENRCPKCERRVVKWIDRILKWEKTNER